jgi:hypothetical protein
MEKLARSEQKFAEELPPIEALRAWLLLLVDYCREATDRPCTQRAAGRSKESFEASYARMWEAIRAPVKRAIKSGDIRKDLDPIDLLRALIGVANVATSPDWQCPKTGRRPHHRFTPSQIARDSRSRGDVQSGNPVTSRRLG